MEPPTQRLLPQLLSSSRQSACGRSISAALVAILSVLAFTSGGCFSSFVTGLVIVGENVEAVVSLVESDAGSLDGVGGNGSSQDHVQVDQDNGLESTEFPGAPHQCSENADVWCPGGTKCCPHRRSNNPEVFGGRDEIVGFSCLMSDGESLPGSCCDDDSIDQVIAGNVMVGTGCADGYVCASSSPGIDHNVTGYLQTERSHGSIKRYCKRDEFSNSKYLWLPRYKICPAFPADVIKAAHGLPVTTSYHRGEGDDQQPRDIQEESLDVSDSIVLGQLAYYSNRGPIHGDGSGDILLHQQSITTAVLVVHGSLRNADDYFCSIVATVNGYGIRDLDKSGPVEKCIEGGSNATSTIRRRRMKRANKAAEEEFMVIAPRFLAPDDEVAKSSHTDTDVSFLRWDDKHPVAHNWRYGADSISSPSNDTFSSHQTTVSSFRAMDVLVETLCEGKERFPNLKKIVVTGHSAGGQFVHRWALTSSSVCFEDSNGQIDLPSIRVVPANPRSYTYIDERRFLPRLGSQESNVKTMLIEGDHIDTVKVPHSLVQRALKQYSQSITEEKTASLLDFRLPTMSELDMCVEYNKYMWGLDDNTDVPTPYVSSNIAPWTDGENNAALFRRYADRDVVYLSGERDIDLLGAQICNDDGYQGPTRRARGYRFYKSIQILGEAQELDEVHRRHVVRYVGHDSALMFQSIEAQCAFF